MTNCSLDHLHFRCSQLEESVDWFKEKLGAKEQFRGEIRGNAVVGMNLGGTSLLLSVPPPQAGVISSSAATFGLFHFGVKVLDLDKTVAELKGKNTKITMEPTTLPNGLKIAFIEGPDNISVELVERA